MAYVAPIVEGHGEVEALPALLHRIHLATAPQVPFRVNQPIRAKAGSFVHDKDYFTRLVTLASAKAAQSQGCVLILLDCEDDCVGELGPQLLERARQVRADVRHLAVLAQREFESWFVAAITSLVGRRGIQEGTTRPDYHEAIRNAKGWLTERMDQTYDPVIHQLEFARSFDLQQARANTSFDRFYERVAGLLNPAQ